MTSKIEKGTKILCQMGCSDEGKRILRKGRTYEVVQVDGKGFVSLKGIDSYSFFSPVYFCEL